MDEKVVEVDMDDINMDELGRKELQALAKSFGIRANQTSEKIKLAILQRKQEKKVVECEEESPVVDNKAVVDLLATADINEIEETMIAGTTNDDSTIVVPPNDDMNDTTVIMPTVSSSTISTTLDVPIDQTRSTPSVASVLISIVGEEQQEHKLILAEDQNRSTISSPALPPSSALVSSPISDHKEPFKASDDHIAEQSTSVITLLNENSDDNDDNKDVSSPKGEICDEKQDDDNNECKNDHKDVSSPDLEVHDKNQDDDNNKCNDDNNDVSSPDGEVYHENQDDEIDNSDSPSDEIDSGEDEHIEVGDNDVSNTPVPDKEPFIASTKKDDTIKKSNIANEKFVTKLPKYVFVRSIVRQKKEVPLWKIHSKDFCHSKGTVRRDKGPGQIKTKPQRKQTRHPLQDRQNRKCPEPVVTATKDYKAVTKKVVPMAMSKRNEEQMQKFLHRQSKGRQERSKIFDAKKYAGIA
ncbi:hypothetical protein FRACYDRAFT_240148 [Fragilariopsis cylindrus CCMP1102]|uniref:Uncharacterized protein n=1 Tax=Fragilariopsis cylindrus CCMP1102 TaxID=635003 RepID=A0A1E7FBC2_9STRA|nr:hypothetical protein FRACYDRAFT_240148 [Fragilariopsis cylindrus CCMP1102]|eukprot:OEU15460.1 hypothetical protein FRACYDRAFT_240148 [Fragilariopsis cylindrus CCMP1102]